MKKMKAVEARTNFAETINMVAYGGERIVIHRHGKDIAAFVSLEDLALLEALEDKLDVEEALIVESKGESPISWNQARLELD